MSLNRHQPRPALFDEHSSIVITPSPQVPYCLSKYVRNKTRNGTKSLHTLENNQRSLNLPRYFKQNSKYKLLSHISSQAKVIFTQRSKRYNLSQQSLNQPKYNLFHARNPQRIRMNTIDQTQTSSRHESTKQMQPQTNGRRILQIKKNDNATISYEDKKQKQITPCSKFQAYVKNLCQLRQESKIVLIRKPKNKSPFSQKQTQSLPRHLPNAVTARPKEIQPFHQRKSAVIQDFAGQQSQKKQIQEIECSLIAKVNQSSFISQFGKNSLMRQLEDDPSSKETIENNKILVKLKNHRKLKNLFPDDFF